MATSDDARFYRGALALKTERFPPTGFPPLRQGADALLTASLDRLGDRTGNEVATPATRNPKGQTMTTTEPTNRPTHRLYAVRKAENDKASWTQIGAAWVNRDGKGFNIKLNLLPLDGSEIVMRKLKDDGEAP